MNSPTNIGVFDSGIGGITVLRALARKFPEENFVYLGDTARLPYGAKSPTTIRKYTEQNLKFLMTKNVKAMVIACNSASTQWSEPLFENTPVFNVIQPGARAALARSSELRIGVLGTRATIESKSYELALKSLNPDVQVFSQASPLLVHLAEEGWIDDPVTNLIVYRYLQPLLSQRIDTLILGCTHYPILQNSIQRVTGQQVELVDSGEALAEDLEQAFVAGRIKRSENPTRSISFYCTDNAETFATLARRLLKDDGIDFENFEMADLQDIR
jgi:glutamate racemase